MNKIKHLYIHIPFCDNICGYCDFTRVKYHTDLVDKYLIHLEKELNTFDLSEELETIYIGGGTPSSLNLKQLNKLFEMLSKFSFEEFTFEANPESLNLAKIEFLKSKGVNRVSLGVQSFNDKSLNLMHRKHTTSEAFEVISNIQKTGITNISIDLMYSLPETTISDLQKDLNQFLKLKIDHLSIYSLTIEPNSEFKRLNISNLDSDTEANMYFEIVKTLEENGYENYEISAFAKNKKYSKHNLAYWKYNDFLGIGLGASSKYNNSRFDNVKSFKDYLDDHYIKTVTPLSLQDLMFENVMMSLRTSFGLDIEEFNQRYESNVLEIYRVALKKHLDKDLIIKKNHLICKKESFALLNDILVDFLD